MPYPPKQEKAIFLSMKRKKGERSARNFMRNHSEAKAGFQYSRDKKRSTRRRVPLDPGKVRAGGGRPGLEQHKRRVPKAY